MPIKLSFQSPQDTNTGTRRGAVARFVLAVLLAIATLTTALAPSSWAAAGGSSLQPGQTLYNGQSLVNGGLGMVMQSDGNFVLYFGSQALWQSGTSGRGGTRVSMQGDGNLVIYNSANQWLWQSGTGGHSGSRLELQSDMNAVVYDSANRPLWQSGTGAGVPTSRESGSNCDTRTLAGIGASVYRVCMKATDSYNGVAVTGYVSSASCNINFPTGVGWACKGFTRGSYWNSSLHAWEDWLNYKLVYVSPDVRVGVYYANCVYLRVDTRPNGYTTYQNFEVPNLASGTTC